MAARPNIVSRRDWGARTTVGGGRGVANSARTQFIVHWPVMGSRDERQWVRDIEAMHARSITSAAAPAYNVLCGMSGTLYEGCGLGVRGPASGTTAANTNGWSCCALQPSTAGGTPTAPVSQAARNSMRALYEWLCTLAGRRLAMRGHRQIVATACPGPDLFAWVQAGMPATGGIPSTPAPEPQAEQEDLMAYATAANGNAHIFMLQGGWVWYAWQAKGSNNWSGGQAGQRVAGMTRFAPAPNAISISAGRTDAGHLHVWIRNRDGGMQYTWQRPNETSWQGGRAGQQIAGFQSFSPVPR